VRTGKLDAVARRRGLVIGSGSRTDREGRPVSWRMTGLERSAAESSHPFFIEWGSSTAHPGDAAAGDSAGRMRIARLDLRGDQDSLSAWLGHARNLPFAVRPGAPEVERIWLEGPDRGEFALDLA
jgi:hypothetical protein